VAAPLAVDDEPRLFLVKNDANLLVPVNPVQETQELLDIDTELWLSLALVRIVNVPSSTMTLRAFTRLLNGSILETSTSNNVISSNGCWSLKG